MRICIDFTSAIGDRTGVGRYTLELTRALLATGTDHEIRLAVHVYRHPGWLRKIRKLLEGAAAPYSVSPNRILPYGVCLETDRLLGLPRVEQIFGPSDVFHGTNFLAPPSKARVVVTIHDLAFVRFAGSLPVPHRYIRYVGRVARRADRVIAVSEATRTDVIELLDVEPSRVFTVPLGAPPSCPMASKERVRDLLRRRSIPDRFFLFVGTLEPRKNLVRLLNSYAAAAARLHEPVGLVIAGRIGWHAGDVLETLREVRSRLPAAYVGWVDEPLRNALYRDCLAFVFPSIYEGFGLPVLEAFSLGAPVVASDRGALPEVVGDAGILVDHESVDELAERLVELAERADLRAELVLKGRRRALRFTWERTAVETLEVYAGA